MWASLPEQAPFVLFSSFTFLPAAVRPWPRQPGWRRHSLSRPPASFQPPTQSRSSPGLSPVFSVHPLPIPPLPCPRLGPRSSQFSVYLPKHLLPLTQFPSLPCPLSRAGNCCPERGSVPSNYMEVHNCNPSSRGADAHSGLFGEPIWCSRIHT